MFVKRDSDKENQILNEVLENEPQLLKEHELFLAEMRFKQLLIDSRKEKGMTQKDISDISGLSQQAVSRLEKGKGGTIDTVVKYLNALGLSLAVSK